jgi:hypothetical protein
VDERFHIKPLLPLLSGDGHFYVLALSQNEIRLLQGSRDSVAVVDLVDVPESLADALRWDDPERQLQWHTGTGARADGRAAIFHGHGVGTDNTKTNILRYFQKVDDGICRILAEDPAPLVLAGVDYLLPIYRSASDYPNLVEGAVTGSPEELSAANLHQAAWPRCRRCCRAAPSMSSSRSRCPRLRRWQPSSATRAGRRRQQAALKPEI